MTTHNITFINYILSFDHPSKIISYSLNNYFSYNTILQKLIIPPHLFIFPQLPVFGSKNLIYIVSVYTDWPFKVPLLLVIRNCIIINHCLFSYTDTKTLSHRVHIKIYSKIHTDVSKFFRENTLEHF